MKYMGSKNRIAKYILPIILRTRKEGQWYVEPFVGGANMIDKVSGNRIGSDINKYLIALLKELQITDQFNPPFVGEERYKEIQTNKDTFEDWLVGYVGFNLSFGAKFFGGYGRDNAGVRNYENEAQQNLLAQQKLLKGINFYCCNYYDLSIPQNSIIYCDPPYDETTKYKDKFDSNMFWEWCRIKAKEGHSVFISEYKAPDDFISIWGNTVNSSLDLDTGSKKNIEQLFIHKSQPWLKPLSLFGD